MFNNLIESSSHRKEFKRRGSFVLCTTITYALMLSVSGVVSIYAYDAHLGEQNYEQVITMLPPEAVTETPRTPIVDKAPKVNNNKSTIPERAIAMSTVATPQAVPPEISTKPNMFLPLPPGPVRITGQDKNPELPGGGSNSAGGGSRVVPPPRIVIVEDPPPAPPQPPKDRVIKVSKVLNSEAISLPKPRYPPLAIQIHLEGVVNVQVLIDEAGRVVSAKAVGGHPVLVAEAVRAATQARFSPTILGDQPVKVSGVISYNFTLNR